MLVGKDSGVDVPITRYATSADGSHIAYRVAGEGSTDLVVVPGWTSRLDVSWQQPLGAKFLQSLASFSRLIMVDRRGSGLSDSVTQAAPPPLEVLAADVRAVLDAVGSTMAALFGEFEGGPVCALFAATYPERTRALILYATYARGAWAPDYPWAWTDEQMEEDIARGERLLQAGWDEDYFMEWAEETFPSVAHDAAFRPWAQKLWVISGNPGSIISLVRWEHALDIRAVLPTIRVPTLVVNRVGDRIAELDEGRWLATQIPDASFLELPGNDHPPWAGDQDSVLEAISTFLGLSRPPAEIDRVLATVLLTDIVDSTRKAVELGDDAWKHLLGAHDERAREVIEAHRAPTSIRRGMGCSPCSTVQRARSDVQLSLGEAMRSLGLEIRAGCHTGEVELDDKQIRGIAVHIGARVAALAGPSELLVSSTVKDLVAGSGLAFQDAGEHELKGVPDRWHLYRVLGS